MNIDKDQILQLLRSQGKDDQASQARRHRRRLKAPEAGSPAQAGGRTSPRAGKRAG